MLQQEKASLLPQNDTFVSLLEDAVLRKFSSRFADFPTSFRPYSASSENSNETDEQEFRCQIFIADSVHFGAGLPVFASSSSFL